MGAIKPDAPEGDQALAALAEVRVDVVPLQRQQLAEAQAGECSRAVPDEETRERALAELADWQMRFEPLAAD